MSEVRKMFDGYDAAIRFADHHIGRIVDHLDDTGLLDETALLVSADHGETLGELGIYCDHQTADLLTTRLPGVLRWPGLGIGGRVDRGLHYQVDLAATVLELLGATVPADWDGVSFAHGLGSDPPGGRDHLVLSHGAWTVQRAVRFADWLVIYTYHDGFHGFPEVMVFDVAVDPHEQHDVAGLQPEVVGHAAQLLEQWRADALRRSLHGRDPLETVIREGGPWHVRGHLDRYLRRLRETDRAEWADRLTAAHQLEDAAFAPSSPVP
jgi:arylsulfatase A-like enzyme